MEISSDPAVGDVHQQEGGPGETGEWLDVVEDGLVGRAVLDGDEDFSIHGGGLEG